MKLNSTIPKTRISSELQSKIKKAMEIINSSDLNITIADFTRMSLKHFSEEIIREGLEITIKPQ